MPFQAFEVADDEYKLDTCHQYHYHVQPVHHIVQSMVKFTMVRYRFSRVVTIPICNSVTSSSVIIQKHLHDSPLGEIESLSDLLNVTSPLSTCIWIDVLMQIEIQAHYLYIIQLFLKICSTVFEWTQRRIGQIQSV